MGPGKVADTGGLRRSLPRLALAGLLAGAGLVLFGADAAFLVAAGPRLALEQAEDFTHGTVSPRGRATAQGVEGGRRGFVVPPGGRGSVRYETEWSGPSTRWASLHVAGLLGGAEVRGRVRVSADGGATFLTLAEDRAVLGESFDVGPLIEGRERLTVLAEADNRSGEPLLLLGSLSLRGYAGPPVSAPPAGRAVFTFGLLAAGAALLSPAWPRGLALAAILTVAFAGRYLNLLRVLAAPLEPDAQGYRLLADRLMPFTDAGVYSGAFGIREPFFLLVSKGVFALLGSSDLHLRFVSLLGSLVVVVLAWRLGRRLAGAWGWIPAALAAASVPAIVESGRGLRLELEMVLLLLFVEAAFLSGRHWSHRAVATGVLGGLLVLTRASHLPGVLALVWLAALRAETGRRRLAAGALAAAACLLVYAPHALALARVHGDPFYDQAMHARWFANAEFAGTPGFPARSEVAREAYAGPRLSPAGYLRLHAPADILTGSIRGVGKILGRMDVIGYEEAVAQVLGLRLGWLDWLVRLAGLAGLLVALWSGHAWLPAAFVALSLPVAFVYDRGLALEPYRLILVVFPLFAAGIALAGRRAGRRLGGLPARRAHA
jgi:hypothetical protein